MTRRVEVQQRAVQACADYDRWASEVARLTAEIAAVECPKEAIPEEGWTQEPSCFTAAKNDPANWTPGGPESAPAPPSLAKLAELVADCPSCSRLCAAIAARREARKRWGVAKRAVRYAARAAGRGCP